MYSTSIGASGDHPVPAAVRSVLRANATLRNMSADELTGLIGGSAAERSAAFSALEATDDAQLAAACVPPLCALLARPAAEIGAAEFQRVSLLLNRLGSLDPVAVGAEMFREQRILALYAEGNALDDCLAKP